ncbi:hypothetical protein NC651_003400 [Populus alba x Populus x berolinensis]|nr:hypothetical protein NC651_003400 [Populus alba x Populus x berolinensis]
MGMLLMSFSLVVLDKVHPPLAPPQVFLYLLLMKIALGSLHCPPLPLTLTLLMFVHFIILMYVLCYLKISVNLETFGNCV